MASCHNNSSPGFLSVFDRFLEVGVEQEVFEVWIGIEGLFDPIEELGTDDATTSPEQCTIAVIEPPVELLAGFLQLHEALSIGANFGSI